MADTIREKIIRQNLETAKSKISRFNDWEKEFYRSIRGLPPERFTPKQFNRLKELSEK